MGPLAAAIANLSAASQAAVQHLVSHNPERPDLSLFPKSRLAGVLVLLFEEGGELRVLLTTRSKDLRTHPGQTALPGGRVDESDITVIQTAFREAHEEVGLPLQSPDIHLLGTLRPFISLHKLVVTPVVALLTDPSIISTLQASEDEVAQIFSHPLEAILDPTLARKEPLVSSGTEDWIYDTELHSTTDSIVAILNNTNYRMHRFRSCATPIKGLTADMLIHVAEIAFDRPTEYDRWAEGQPRAFATTVQSLAFL
ncbi:Nudix hydrolase domain-containing protein [Mycena venus]|uniref:Nudix hydrolase domain-containing protein n=1 Tax=Mycena venus TaxID=2733690 RepID=A0A8H6YFE2_9AGAR|nr:Nudix hydrolase domain-containing protein [Mycena venus]